MEMTKQDFGRFVTDRRRRQSLTQRELASRLHVTESAVSKWERGLSYPDITLVAALAEQLGVSPQELISTSEDRVGRLNQRDARTYRRWRASILWSTAIAYATAILVCFVVNISVEHTLSWFWVLLPAVSLAFCLTTLPLLPIPRPGWSALAGSVLSLGLLLLVVWVAYAPGGWLAIACTAILFGLVLVFGPIWLWLLGVPGAAARHRTMIALGIDTVALLLFLLVVMVVVGRPELWVAPVLPVVGIAVIPVWMIAVAIRYLPVNGLGKAAVVVAFLGVCVFGINWAIESVLHRAAGIVPEPAVLDLGRWQEDTISTNVQFLVMLGALVVAAVLAICALLRYRAERHRR